MILRVVIVEDEPPILRDLQSVLEEIPHVKVMGCAQNGEEALAIIKKRPVDVIFTDIKMPVMDGLELIQRVQNSYPNILNIIITGYDDFSYAQTACRLHVEAFILKPIDEVELIMLIRKLVIKHIQFYSDAISRFFSGNSSEHNKQSTLFANRYKNVLFLRIVVGFYTADIQGELDQFDLDIEGLRRNLQRALTMEDDVWCIKQRGLGHYLLCISFASEYNQAPQDLVHNLILRTRQHIQNHTDIFYTIITEGVFCNLEEAGEKVRKTLGLLKAYVIPGRQTIARSEASRLINDRQGNIKKDGSLLRYLARAAAEGHKQSFKTEMGTLLDQWEADGVDQHQLEANLDEIIDLLVRNMFFVEKMDTRYLRQTLNTRLYACRDYGHIRTQVYAFCEEIFEKKVATRKNQRLVADIELFLKGHLSEPINTQSLAEVFNLVPHYLSRVYKKYKKLSPIEHLSVLRIEKAREMIEKSSESTIKDIAFAVGFNDQAYFSKVFKKITGMGPSEYRDSFQYRESADK